MHKIKEMVYNEISEIESVGITKSNLKLLGELVDIYKDLTNIEYWRFKISSSNTGDDRVRRLKELYASKQAGTPVDEAALKALLVGIINDSEGFYECLKKFKLPTDLQERFNKVFK